MVSRATLYVIGFTLSSIPIIVLITITLLKATSDPTVQDVIGIIQAVTGIFGVLGFIFTTGLFLYDRQNERTNLINRLTDKSELGQLLPSMNYGYQGGLIECAKAHIERLCEIQLVRYKALSGDNKPQTDLQHVSSNLIELKYDKQSKANRESKWTEVGEHFDSEFIMRMITGNAQPTNPRNAQPINLLIEVVDIELNLEIVQFIYRQTLAAVKPIYFIT
jgi:hypothetical protein